MKNKVKEGLILINQIEKLRSKNNKNWMDLVRLALKIDFEKTAKLLNKINMHDRKISQISSKIKNLK
jgi:hypothetical protein